MGRCPERDAGISSFLFLGLPPSPLPGPLSPDSWAGQNCSPAPILVLHLSQELSIRLLHSPPLTVPTSPEPDRTPQSLRLRLLGLHRPVDMREPQTLKISSSQIFQKKVPMLDQAKKSVGFNNVSIFI